jgi:uncharacterized protein (DUF2147 family)
MRTLLFVAAAAGLVAARAQASDPVEGQWLVEDGDAKVQVGACAGAPAMLCGRIVWLREPKTDDGVAKRDEHNPDPGLRGRPIIGLPLIREFHAAGPGRWEGGKIYDPKSGKTYASRLRIAADGTLRVSGCVAMFCQTQTWTRAS